MGKSFDTARNDGAQRAFQARLETLDWDFATQLSESPFSWLHWHPCRFPSQLPSLLISRLSNVGETVLDPFMGSATTLVEAQRLGRPSIGIDINPISVLIARAKTLDCSLDEIVRFIDRTTLEVQSNWSQLRLAQLPAQVQADKWYTSETLLGLRRLWTVVSGQSNAFATLSQAAFSSILLPCCREERHWGYVCDNTMPKTYRSADARDLFLKAMNKFKQAYLLRETETRGTAQMAEVLEGDASSMLQAMREDSISCIVTSPPYFGVADYVKAQRLSMEWFSYDIETLRLQEIGARSKRRRTTASSDYLKEMNAVFSDCYRVLRPGGHIGIVYGQSPSREKLYDSLMTHLRDVGFKQILVKSRRVSASRRMIASLSDEIVLIMQKEG